MTRRLIVPLLLSLLLAFPLAGSIAPRVGAQPDESIPSTFQVYECPENYAGREYLDDCAPVGAGDYAITVIDTHPTESTATTETDADGFVSFVTVPGPTSWSLTASGAVAFYSACFDGNGIYLFDGQSNLIEATLAEGDALNCRWYVTPGATDPAPGSPEGDPADATVGVQVFDCPEGYDGAEAEADCVPTARPVGITLNDGYDFDESTAIYDQAGEDGKAGFVDLKRGSYYLAVDDLSGTTAIFHVCTGAVTSSGASDREVYGTRGTHNRIRLSLSASQDISCAIYLTDNGPTDPEPGTPGSITLTVMSCPEGFDGPVWSEACTRPIDSNLAYIPEADRTESTLYDLEDTVEIYEGTAIFRNVPAGEVMVSVDIPGHGAEFAGGCVQGAGPVSDDVIGDGTTVELEEDAGATCAIYVTPVVFRG